MSLNFAEMPAFAGDCPELIQPILDVPYIGDLATYLHALSDIIRSKVPLALKDQVDPIHALKKGEGTCMTLASIVQAAVTAESQLTGGIVVSESHNANLIMDQDEVTLLDNRRVHCIPKKWDRRPTNAFGTVSYCEFTDILPRPRDIVRITVPQTSDDHTLKAGIEAYTEGDEARLIITAKNRPDDLVEEIDASKADELRGRGWIVNRRLILFGKTATQYINVLSGHPVIQDKKSSTAIKLAFNVLRNKW